MPLNRLILVFELLKIILLEVMKSKSVKDLYEQGLKLMKECSFVGWNGSDYSSESIKRMELIHLIMRIYVDNIVLHLTGSNWLPNDKYDTKVPRYIYAQF